MLVVNRTEAKSTRDKRLQAMIGQQVELEEDDSGRIVLGGDNEQNRVEEMPLL